MTMTMMIGLIPIGLLGILALNLHYRKRRQLMERRQQGLAIIRQQVDLIRLIQQHRGLHVAYLQGKSAFAGRLSALEQDIDRQIDKLDCLIQIPDADLEPLCTQWLQIKNGQQHWSHDTSFFHHSRLIEQIRDAICTMADRHALTSSADPQLRHKVIKSVQILPELVESLGQVRALSVQAASSGQCSAQLKLRLMYLMRIIQRLLEQGPSESQARAIHKILQEIERDVMEAKQVQVSPDQLFQHMTDVIDAQLIQMRRQLDSLESAWLSAASA